VDEMLAQLLASEGFDSVEELAYVDLEEISSIDGLDEETATELQTRAREHLEKVAAEQEARRKEMGVEDTVAAVEGVTPAMLVALGEAGVLSLEDLAGCATDDLVGWSERQDGETIHHRGAFSDLDVSGAEAEAIIMAARIAAGWIEPPSETEEAEETEEVEQATEASEGEVG
jgi:N utilization substance protein A